jgi:bis(5'-nucleosyl)-tetraphosphatase (symmetrical)
MHPTQWSHTLTGMDRLRVIVNALTRLRFCTAQGAMEFDTKEGAAGAPAGYMPWFDIPRPQTARRDGSIWPLVHFGLAGAERRAIHGHRLCVGRRLERIARGHRLQDATQELIQVQCEAEHKARPLALSGRFEQRRNLHLVLDVGRNTA